MEDFDALFEQYADKAESEARASAGRGNGGFQRTYENIAWTGLTVGTPTVFRAVGGPPDSNIDNYTARTCTISRVVGDDGSKFKLIRDEADPDYIINRILAKVNYVRWSNQKDANGKSIKTYPNRELLDNDARTKDITNRIDKNGLTEADKAYIFERGWKGSKVLIMNIIDRSMMDWHKEHKHTRLLAKSVTESNGNEFVDEGISSFAVSPEFVKLFKAYGSWEKYDIAITRTGTKNKPYDISNASHSPMEVDSSLRQVISQDQYLTDEERSWERYDIAKFYKPTSVIKIQNKLGKTIARIDSVLGTDFARDLAREVEKERARLAEEHAEDAPATTSAPATSTVEAPKRVREAVAPAKTETSAEMPFISTLSPEIRAKVKSAKPAPNAESDKHWDVEWNCDVSELAACPECGSVSPLEGVNRCPVCGEQF